MTREEHIAVAERFARENPQWRWDGIYLSHATGAFVPISWQGGSWTACTGKEWLLGPRGGMRRFRSPAAAVRALGLPPAPESTDAR